MWFVLRGMEEEEEEEERSEEKIRKMKEEGSEGWDGRRGWCSGLGSGREVLQGMRVGRSWCFRHGGEF